MPDDKPSSPFPPGIRYNKDMNRTVAKHLLYGRTGLEIALPETTTVLAGTHATPLPDPLAAIRQAMAQPLGSPSLSELLRRKKPKSVAITISDITRPVPNKLILPVLLEILHAQGIAPAQITIIVGTGMHRPSTPAEHEELLGKEILQRYHVVDHRADDPATLVRLPTPPGTPSVSVNALFVQADFRIVTGLIEPHFMAGFSGGRKGVCPALVDLATVQRFHGHAILSDPRSANGNLADNPCHAESLRIARIVGVDFLVNVAIDSQRRLCGVYAGDMETAHLAGTQDVGRWTSATITQPFDLVVTCGGGYPLDQTFYQTVKGMVTALPACHANTTLLIASDCAEGVGSPSYADQLKAYANDWKGFLSHIASHPVAKKDQWQLQMQCRVLEKIGQQNLRLVCDGLPQETQAGLWVHPVLGEQSARERMQKFIDEYLSQRPDARVAVIPDGPYTLL